MENNDFPESYSEYLRKFSEFASIFDSLPDGVIAVLNINNLIITANKPIAKLLDLPLEEIIGKNAFELMRDRMPHLIAIVEETFRTGKNVRNYTIDINTPDGDINSFLISTAFIKEISPPDRGIILVIHDVSEITRLRKTCMILNRYEEIIGQSEKIREIYGLIECIKRYKSTVLIVGETGTGKELVARAIHNTSVIRNKPFVPVNCAALPENLIESELFGHEKGAFTGAVTRQTGKFLQANGGTIFLDEVGTLTMSAQTKLLRILQYKIVEPLGSSSRIPVDVRILAATNMDLTKLSAEGKFRDDLYYRLKVIQVNVPPLRERKDDIPFLVDFFINRLCKCYNEGIVSVSPKAKKMLLDYEWPGNVRELENVIESAFVRAEGALLEISHFPIEIRQAGKEYAPPISSTGNLHSEKENIRNTLLTTKGSKSKAAEILGMHRTTLWRKIRELNIDKDFGKK